MSSRRSEGERRAGNTDDGSAHGRSSGERVRVRQRARADRAGRRRILSTTEVVAGRDGIAIVSTAGAVGASADGRLSAWKDYTRVEGLVRASGPHIVLYEQLSAITSVDAVIVVVKY